MTMSQLVIRKTGKYKLYSGWLLASKSLWILLLRREKKKDIEMPASRAHRNFVVYILAELFSLDYNFTYIYLLLKYYEIFTSILILYFMPMN